MDILTTYLVRFAAQPSDETAQAVHDHMIANNELFFDMSEASHEIFGNAIDHLNREVR